MRNLLRSITAAALMTAALGVTQAQEAAVPQGRAIEVIPPSATGQRIPPAQEAQSAEQVAEAPSARAEAEPDPSPGSAPPVAAAKGAAPETPRPAPRAPTEAADTAASGRAAGKVETCQGQQENRQAADGDATAYRYQRRYALPYGHGGHRYRRY